MSGENQVSTTSTSQYTNLWSLLHGTIRVSHSPALGPRYTALHKLIVDLLLNKDAAASAAALALVEE